MSHSSHKKNSNNSEVTPPPLVPLAERRWLTIPEAASCIAVSPNTVRGFIHDQELRAVPIGLMFRIDRNDLDEFMLRRKKVVAPYRRGSRPWVAERHAKDRVAKQAKKKRAGR